MILISPAVSTSPARSIKKKFSLKEKRKKKTLKLKTRPNFELDNPLNNRFQNQNNILSSNVVEQEKELLHERRNSQPRETEVSKMDDFNSGRSRAR